MKLLDFLDRNFMPLIVAGIVLGLFFRQSLAGYRYLLPAVIAFSLFLSGLKVSPRQFLSHVPRLRYLVFAIGLMVLLVPLALYFVLRFIHADFALAALLLFGLPVGITVPLRAEIFKGDVALAILLSTMTHLLLPFSLSTLVFFAGARISLDAMQLFWTLAALVLAPFLLAQALRFLWRSRVGRHQPIYSPLNIIVLAFLIVPLAVSGLPEDALSRLPELAGAVLAWLTLAVLLMLAGLHFPGTCTRAERVTYGLAFHFRNAALGLGIAALYFPPAVFFFFMAFELLIDWLIIPFNALVKKFQLA